MKIDKLLVLIGLGLSCVPLGAQPGGEATEPSPEYLDAAFTSEDADRVAAGFSDELIASPPGDLLDNMMQAADLVFRGTVLSQSYEYDASDTPYTHTTFSIAESLKGDYSSTELTLVQPGGPSRENSDRIMMASNSQFFSVGEEELLFMNLDTQNPRQTLRATVASRFRIHEGRMYNEDGFGVIVVPLEDGSYRLDVSETRSTAEHFRKINIGTHWLNKHVVDGDDDSLDGLPAARSSAAKAAPGSIRFHTLKAMIQASGG